MIGRKRTCDCKNCRPGIFSSTFGAVDDALEWIPGYKLLRFFFVIVLIWAGLHYFTPGYDVPYVPFAACQNAPEKPSGLAAIAYDAGSALHAVETSRPSVRELRAGAYTLAQKAGELWGTFKSGANAEPIPPAPLITPRKGSLPIANNCCTDSGGGSGSLSVSGPITGAGIEAAARAVLAAGPKWADGGPDAVQALAISGAESDYGQNPHNPHTVDGSNAEGLFQVMMPMHADMFASGESPRDLAANARVAYKLWEAGGWAPWSSSQSQWGAHMAEAQAEMDKLKGSSGSATSVAATTAQTSVSASGADISDSGSTPSQPRAVAAAAFIRQHFGFKGTIGGSADLGHISDSLHYRGLAIDVMVGLGNTKEGQPIADYFAGPGYKTFGVDNVIYNRKIYNAGRGWHDYPDRLNATLNHEDHVHIDFYPGAAPTSAAAPGETSAASCPNTTIGASLGASGTTFGVTSFNVLGSSHTGRGGESAAYGPGVSRMQGAVNALLAHKTDVVGFQELQNDQAKTFDSMTQGTFQRWHSPRDTSENSIAWRTDTFQFLRGKSLAIPYFYGNTRWMPAVHLKYIPTGAKMWFINVHNPANVRGPAGQWRREAARREFALAHRLNGPVILTGDFNDRGFGDTASHAGFLNPGIRGIDYVLGTNGATLGAATVDKSVKGLVSDHPLVFVEAAAGRVS